MAGGPISRAGTHRWCVKNPINTFNISNKVLFLNLILQQCDSNIYDILAEAEAQDYAAHFARHRVTWEMLKTMTDSELKEV